MANQNGDESVLQFPILIGDIGGTNARFAILLDSYAEPKQFPIVQTADFATIDDAIQTAILDRTSVQPRSAVLAVAGPVDGDEIELTNCPWVVRPRVMIENLGLRDVVVLNDFEAQALAVVALGEEHMEKIGPGTPEPTAGRVVLGPGTGLGVAGLIHACNRWIPVPGEGGHMDIGPRTPRDFQVFPHLEPIEGRISGEQLLCGRGLVNIYRAVAKADGAAPRFTTPAEITGAALEKSYRIAEEALSIFVTCLGRTAGDLALVFMSRGGVYLTGGIAQKIVPALQTGEFRAAFEDKAPHKELMRDMPVYVITHPLAALAGLAAYARTPVRFGVETSGRRWKA
ncbi:glucokinase [Mesorhizobium sp. ZC-5]|uniref:glucokinase n=1 Tax=Mesorhizobium sp. ZC-5 TaxID=2986066 RepID=UPI0021E82070|nr:glucokinase [Mesorhizobium sp. ZC-5]MCV3239300.1 glucokinase [Mesorhizobium sp. ZC-5]